MKAVFKLAGAQVKTHWLRSLFSFLAITISTSLIVVMVGGYQSAMESIDKVIGKTLGRFDFILEPGSKPKQRRGSVPPRENNSKLLINEALVTELSKDPDVRQLMCTMEFKVEVANPTQPPMPRVMFTALAGTDSKEPPSKLAAGDWNSLKQGEAVLSESSAKRLKLKTGEIIRIKTRTGQTDLKVGGLYSKANNMQQYGRDPIYVSPKVFERISGLPCKVNKVSIELKSGVNNADFKSKLSDMLIGLEKKVHFLEPADMRQSVQMSLRGGRHSPMMGNAGSILAVLAAIFIVFTALSMGVQERSRQLSMLRAIGMTRFQIFMLVVCEGLILALAGWLCGLALSWALLKFTSTRFSNVFPDGLDLNFFCIWLSALCAFGTVLLASIFPASTAVAKKPLDAIQPTSLIPKYHFPLKAAIAGILLISINPIVVFTSWFPENWQDFLIPSSYVTTIIGFALLSAPFIQLIEKLAGPVIAMLLGLDRRLLAQSLSCNLWRTVGTSAALMMGLGLFVTIQIWGRSMMVPFILTEQAPDMVASFLPEGIPADKAEEMQKIPGVVPGSVLPLTVEQPKLSRKSLAGRKKKGGSKNMLYSEQALYIGADMTQMITGDCPMLGSRLIRGNMNQVREELKDGRHCLISSQFYLKEPENFDVGKTIGIQAGRGKRGEREYIISGILEIPGWHLLSKNARMRRGYARAAGVIIVPTATAEKDLRNDSKRVFWMKTEPNADEHLITERLEAIADECVVLTDMPFGGQAEMKSYPVITSIREMTEQLLRRCSRMIWMMAVFPLYALMLASLAVANTIFSSLRVRRWEIGIYRSVGMSGGQLFRMVMAEALMIGVTASVFSLLLGLSVSYTGIYVTEHKMLVSAPYVIPWLKLGFGFLVALVICVLAAIIPAIQITRTKPLALLQAGRISM
jgi:putative ABC transport system permease protein